MGGGVGYSYTFYILSRHYLYYNYLFTYIHNCMLKSIFTILTYIFIYTYIYIHTIFIYIYHINDQPAYRYRYVTFVDKFIDLTPAGRRKVLYTPLCISPDAALAQRSFVSHCLEPAAERTLLAAANILTRIATYT